MNPCATYRMIAAAVFTVGLASVAPAQNAPLDLTPGANMPAPKPPVPGAAPAGGPMSNPVKRSVKGKAGIEASAQELAAQVNAYYNNLRYATADFVQIGPDGRRTTGKFYLDKPGKVRFQYDPPSPIELVADGTSVAVRDRKMNTQEVYYIAQTPLRFLLADKVDLFKDAKVTSVSSDSDYVMVNIEEKQAIGGTNHLMIMFSAADMSLKQWTVTDAQGFDTSVAVHNLDPTKKPDAKLFRINFERALDTGNK